MIAVGVCTIAIILALFANADVAFLSKFTTKTSRSTAKSAGMNKANKAPKTESVRVTKNTSSGTENSRKKKASAKPKNKDEVGMTEYHLAGLNHTLHMKQNWWHAHEASAGEKVIGQPVPTWEAAFVVADYLTRHKDPWAPTKLHVLRAAEGDTAWSWRRSLFVVLGAEIGLVASAAGLRGAMVVSVDASIRLLEAARNNVQENVPEELRRVAMRKILWGSAVPLQGITDCERKPSDCIADTVVLTHADCEALWEADLFQSALSVIGPDTLLLVAFSKPDCKEMKMQEHLFEIEPVPTSAIHPDFVDSVTLLALKQKPQREAKSE